MSDSGSLEAAKGTSSMDQEEERTRISSSLPSSDPAHERHPHPNTTAGLERLLPDGEMGALIREMDWSQTAIGPSESWSPTLRMMVRFLLANRFPLLLWWGPQYVSIYNDPYRPVLGTKHPWALGQPVSLCWSEIWHILQPLIDTPFNGGPATWNDDIFLEINRYGFVEETHFTIAYSPVPDETVPSGIGGVLATVHEITEKVIGERRVVALRDLGTRVGDAKTAEEAGAIAAETLTQHPKDVPFALVYLIDADGKRARLAGTSGVAEGDLASPLEVGLAGPEAGQRAWPLAEAVRAETMQVVVDLDARFGDAVPPGPWPDPPRQAVVVPIRSNVAHQLAGLVVIGISARLKLDDLYRTFLELVATQIATSIAGARAYEEERKRAEALAAIDRAKTAFFSNVSHEFRTPLTLLLSPLEDTLAQPDRLPAADRERLEVAHRNSLRLLKLVNTLLDFSRIEAGRIQASYQPTDLAAFTMDLASSFRSACERAGVRLVVECSPLPEPAYVDPDMWEKIILNLLGNAFKFTLVGEIEVRQEALDRRVRLTVRDTGVGIPPEEMPRMFERFHRVKDTRGRTQEGTGIGLALVQELVKLHGGTVAVDSVLGEGSTFTVTLPLGKAHLDPRHLGEPTRLAPRGISSSAFGEEALRWLPDAEPPVKQSWDQASSSPVIEGDRTPPSPAPSKGGRILWADDNADMRGYVTRLLDERFDVEAVPDGEAALAAARAKGPDLVLSDVMMPKLDGFGLLRALRADPSTAEIPVILLSARSGEESRIEGVAAGADDYLIKPFSARELVARVETHVKMSRMRREARAALRESEARFRAIFEQTQVGIAQVDSSGRFELLNDRYCEIVGRPREELLTLRMQDITDPEDRPGNVPLFEQAVRDGSSFVIEKRYVRPDGSRTWVENTVTALRDADEQVRHVVAVVEEVTGRKQAEESREQFVALVENSGDFIGMSDLDGHVIYVNPAGCALVGLDGLAEVRTTSVSDYLPDTEQQRFSESITPQVLATGYWEGETTFRHFRSGDPIGVYRKVFALRDPRTGTPTCLATVAVDIRGRKQAETDLRQSEERYRGLVVATTSVVWTVDPEGRFIKPQPSWEAYTGQPWEAHRDFGWAEALHPEDREAVMQAWFQARDARTLYEARGRLWHAALREYRHFVARAAAVMNPDGSVREWIGTVTDIEAQWQAEEHLRDMERMESVGRLAGGVAHEVNNQMTVVLGCADFLLRRSDLPPTAHSDLSHIRQAADRSATITQQLLAFGRRQLLRPQLVDLHVLLTDLMQVLHRTMGTDVAVELHLAPAICRVVADARQLQQVLINLALNARDAMPQGGTLRIATSHVVVPEAASRAKVLPELGPGAYCLLTVSDTGCGMDEETLGHIFEPFFTTKPVGEGTGLGLSSVYGMVKQSGGDVAVESEPDRGTTFRLYFPLSEATPGEGEPAAAPEPPGHSATVLVAEDDDTVRAMICRILREDGHRVLEATDGRQAIELLAQVGASINLLVTDVAMPHMGGRELAEHLGRLRPGVPTLYVSGYPGPEMIARGMLEDGMPFLNKPFSPDTLAMRVRQLLSPPSSEEPPPST